MGSNYEDIVRKWYNRLKPDFLRNLTTKYPQLTLGDAEDLYQDTFIAIQENLQQGRVAEDTKWRSYVMTIGLNLASREMRLIRKIDSADDGFGYDDDSPSKTARAVEDILKTLPEEEIPLAENLEAQAMLGDELAHTPEPCASIIRLFYYEESSMDSIAESVGYKNASTAKAKKSQCMNDLVVRVKNALFRAGITDGRN
jgi:DNA-directed RNA polymerase specialized sigma24 family protein